ncbi:hypothetical protein Tco_1335202 [Tanacetum coccineum]
MNCEEGLGGFVLKKVFPKIRGTEDPANVFKRPPKSAGKEERSNFLENILGDGLGGNVRSAVNVSFGFWSKKKKPGRLSSFLMEKRGIRLMLAPRSAKAKHSFISGKSHGRRNFEAIKKTPLRVVIAFTSPFGLAMVLLGREPEPEVEAVLLFMNLVIRERELEFRFFLSRNQCSNYIFSSATFRMKDEVEELVSLLETMACFMIDELWTCSR